MDSQPLLPEEQKEHKEDVQKRYSAIVKKWSTIPSSSRTLLKLLPLFVLVFAVAITVVQTQKQQNTQQNAAKSNSIYDFNYGGRKYHCINGKCVQITPTPINREATSSAH